MHRLAQRDSFVDYRSRPVINYTVYLNNFPINAERHLVRLDFSIQNLSTNILLFYLYLLTYLLTYSSHDKTVAKFSEAWKSEIEFAKEENANPFFLRADF